MGEGLTAEYITRCLKSRRKQEKQETSTHPSMHPHPFLSLFCYLLPVQRIVSSGHTLCPFSLCDQGVGVAGHSSRAGSSPSLKFNITPQLHNESRKGRERTNEPPTAAFTTESPRVIFSPFCFFVACETFYF